VGLLEPHELQTWRLLHAAPQPYTRERFEDTYNWTVNWNMTARRDLREHRRQPGVGVASAETALNAGYVSAWWSRAWSASTKIIVDREDPRAARGSGCPE